MCKRTLILQISHNILLFIRIYICTYTIFRLLLYNYIFKNIEKKAMGSDIIFETILSFFNIIYHFI